jgi:hypothetical protein
MTDMVLPAVFIQHSVPEIAEKLVRPQPLTYPLPPPGERIKVRESAVRIWDLFPERNSSVHIV